VTDVFDDTEENGELLFREDRRLYHLQIESKRHFGYTIRKNPSFTTIDPSKGRKFFLEPSSTTVTS